VGLVAQAAKAALATTAVRMTRIGSFIFWPLYLMLTGKNNASAG
jgi:hypothetical protein